MEGIVFFRTREYEDVVEFYRDLGASVWLKQPDCTILDAGGFRFGFCDRETADTEGIITFVYPDRDGVDEMYAHLADRAEGEPVGEAVVHVVDARAVWVDKRDDSLRVGRVPITEAKAEPAGLQDRAVRLFEPHGRPQIAVERHHLLVLPGPEEDDPVHTRAPGPRQ